MSINHEQLRKVIHDMDGQYRSKGQLYDLLRAKYTPEQASDSFLWGMIESMWIDIGCSGCGE